MSVVIEGATIPMDVESTSSSLENTRIKDLSATRVIFFAGDDVTPTVKYEMMSVKGFGGIDMPHIKTLPKANKGMLYRCQLTPLRTANIIENKLMLSPDKREGGEWESGFIQTNGTRNDDGTYSDRQVNGFLGSSAVATKEGRFENKLDNAYLFKRRYPGTDVKMAVKRSVPHGAGGVVEVTALQGATSQEIHAAQLFFFPDWRDTRKGIKSLPATMRELETHIKSRKAAISELPTELHQKYRSIADDMLKSCNQFRIAYMTTFQKNEIILKDAAAKGHTGAAFPESAEQALSLLEVRRKEDIVTGEASAVSELAREMKADRDEARTAKDRELAIRERELYLKEVELGIRKVEDVPIVKEPEPEPTYVEDDETGQVVEIIAHPTQEQVETFADDIAVVSESVCGAPTANGSCKRTLEAGKTKCWQHTDGD